MGKYGFWEGLPPGLSLSHLSNKDTVSLLYEHQEPELLNKIKEFETEYGSIVYAVTHELFWFGECYSFLIVSKYDEEWEITLEEVKDGYAFSYVWNKTNEECSEFGTIAVRSFGGGIARVG